MFVFCVFLLDDATLKCLIRHKSNTHYTLAQVFLYLHFFYLAICEAAILLVDEICFGIHSFMYFLVCGLYRGVEICVIKLSEANLSGYINSQLQIIFYFVQGQAQAGSVKKDTFHMQVARSF